MPLAEVQRTVAAAAGLPVCIVPAPAPLLRPAVFAMNALCKNPLSTPSQLRMLQEGMVGDPEPAKKDLGVTPRALDAVSARSTADAVPGSGLPSLRFVTGRAHAEWLRAQAAPAWLALGFAALVAALIAWLPVAGFWWRMAAGSAVLLPTAFLAAGPRLLPLLRPSWPRAVGGLAAAIVQYAIGAGIFALLTAAPRLAADFAVANAWRAEVPMGLGLLLLAFIVTTEEVVWRGMVTLPLAGRYGAPAGIVAGAVLAGAAHVPLGLPLLVIAAFAAGLYWGALAVRTRSLVPAIVCHFAFDAMIFYVRPYAG
jgi:membrane protease YdiL (CAAX protease family)